MRWNIKSLKLVIFAFVLFLICITIYWNSDKNLKLLRSADKWNKTKTSVINICAVACGENRVQEVFVLIKSALVFSMKRHHLQFVIISEKPMFQSITEKLETYQTRYEFSFLLREINFPEKQREVWKKLFKPCASQRLFLPSLLPEIDKLIYMDSDTLFLSSPIEIYEQFTHFNSTQLAGLIQESENKNTGWYTRFARHEYPHPYGLNSGVMLMDLEKMRKIYWEEHLMPIYDKYNLKIVFGDQDIINIYFYYHPDQYYILGSFIIKYLSIIFKFFN
jgi:UDP-xylose:glucoside alpha-1,3-xylosyltransferase